MAYECKTQVERQIKGVTLPDSSSTDAMRKQIDADTSLRKQQETEVQGLWQAKRSLEAGAEALASLHKNIVCGQAQQIAHLAVEIARKILRSKVEEGDYRIEAVVQEALSQAPTKHSVTVRLHPEDMARCKEVQDQDGNGVLGALELIADASVGRAECIIETPKGSIESVIEEHLARVEDAIRSSWQPS
jgi:flagellar biosynthesis/type III secretory pathway protein FliH